ncbi:MAG: hypothetical protein JWO21_955, partial [Solirubrobacterales bacterium]|nr:hypothetical protein [Solirubrobacterales bacterium]
MRGKILIGAALLAGLMTTATSEAGAATLSVHVLSDRANLISGPEALVSVDLPRGVQASAVKMTLGGTDVTSQFAMRPNGSYEGLLTGLTPGSNIVTAEAPGGLTAQATIVDHPIGGP